MRSPGKGRLVTAVAFLLLLAAASSLSAYFGYQVGGRVGFVHGFGAGSWSSDTTNAALTTFVLDQLHQGDLAAATSSLEQQVDSGILSYWAYTLAGDSKFDRSGVVAKSRKTIQRVAAYRSLHPPYYREGDLGETIQEVLAQLRTSDE